MLRHCISFVRHPQEGRPKAWGFLGLLGASWGLLGGLLGLPSRALGPSWGRLGRFRSQANIKLNLKATWKRLGGFLTPSWSRLGAIWGPSWDLLGSSWGLLESSWGALGACWAALRAILNQLGRLKTHIVEK